MPPLQNIKNLVFDDDARMEYNKLINFYMERP